MRSRDAWSGRLQVPQSKLEQWTLGLAELPTKPADLLHGTLGPLRHGSRSAAGSIAVLILQLSCFGPAWSQALPKEDPGLDADRMRFAESVIAQYGAHISQANQDAILRQQVILGMSPYEASLAAGAYSFDVVADPAKWPKGTDPNRVIAAQSLHPDNSQITCVFRNATQFPELGTTRFKVIFSLGRAIRIEAMN
jgi:hypothetical protein